MSDNLLFLLLLLNLLFITPICAQAGWSGPAPVNEPGSYLSVGPVISFDSEGKPWAIWYNQPLYSRDPHE